MCLALCVGSVKASKKVITSFAKNAIERVAQHIGGNPTIRRFLQHLVISGSDAEVGVRASIESAVPSQITDVPLLEAPKMVKHHIFNVFRGNSANSQKYRAFFKKIDIEIDSYCVEIPQHFHTSEIHALKHNWTTKLKQWIDAHSDATTK